MAKSTPKVSTTSASFHPDEWLEDEAGGEPQLICAAYWDVRVVIDGQDGTRSCSEHIALGKDATEDQIIAEVKARWGL